ncbi:MAG: hypothetical protein IT495_17920 [Gammaproteobacteria bacterium]|nr:hypothetical protein [Gammaproteobacteria bacterium]
MTLMVPVSVGELIDKITILEIKAERIADPVKRGNVERELAMLREVWRKCEHASAPIDEEYAALKRVNSTLWDIEDRIRDKERTAQFDAGFIELARQVYLNNDARAALKRELNVRLGSTLVEEKSYSVYQDTPGD